MTKICDLDIEKYKCVTPDIQASEVIITDERIKHIKDHHPGDFEKINSFFEVAIKNPDYILEDSANSGLVLKRIEEENLKFELVLRLRTSKDSENYKNSILSAWIIGEDRWKNYIKNKKILYKDE